MKGVVIGMVRAKTIVGENNEVQVVEEVATVFSNDDIVLDSVSYDILVNELESFKEYSKYIEDTFDRVQRWYDSLPKWVRIIIERFSSFDE